MSEKNTSQEFEQTLDIDNQKETFIFKCDGCGGNMVFDPQTQLLMCPHCKTTTDFSKSNSVREIEIEQGFNVAEKWDEGNSTYRCENCGAVVVLDVNDVATICPYCETPHIVKSEELAGLKPNVVYPFTVTQESAVAFAKKFAKRKVFAPKKFKKTLNQQDMKGVYEPCFTYDSQTFSTYYGRVGEHRTRTVGSGKNRRTETYTVWRNISGTHAENFNDVFVNATSSYSEQTFEKLLPYKYQDIKVYQKHYLSGYMARRSEISLMDGFTVAKGKMDKEIRSGILRRHDHDVVDYLNVSTTHSNVTYKYALVPTYFINYKYKDKIYTLYVNGNTGKVTGKTPVSVPKVLLAVFGGLLIVAGIIYLLITSGAIN